MTEPTGEPQAAKPSLALDGASAATSGPTVELPDAESAARISVIEAMTPKQAPVRLGRSVLFSFALATVGAGVWAAISYASNLEIGIIAVGVGFLAGFGAVKGGRGQAAQLVGAAAGAYGFFLGQSLYVLLVADSADRVLHALSLHPVHVATVVLGFVLKRTFGSLDMVFLAICVWEGWKIPRGR